MPACGARPWARPWRCAGWEEAAPAASRALAIAFLVALEAVAGSGMLLLALRGTPAAGVALVIHLGTLVGLYVTAPYGKLVHGVYRLAAILRDAGERRREESA